MTPKGFVLMVWASSLFIPATGLAHHDLKKEFDTGKSITLTGEVKRVDWSNPHVRLYLDVAESGNTVTWEVDMGPPNLQLMRGWKIDTYKRGDHVMVDAYPARNGSKVVYGTKIAALRSGYTDVPKPSRPADR